MQKSSFGEESIEKSKHQSTERHSDFYGGQRNVSAALLKSTSQNSLLQSLNSICKDIPTYANTTGHSGTYLV